MVGRVEAERGDIAKGTDHFAVVCRAQRVTAIFDQPQVVLFTQCFHLAQIEWVAQGVSEHDGLGLRRDGGFDQVCIDVVGVHFNIDEHRDRAELNDRVNSSRETRSNANDFVAFF